MDIRSRTWGQKLCGSTYCIILHGSLQFTAGSRETINGVVLHLQVLVGDPKQLPPTIGGSEPAHDQGLEYTLFERLADVHLTPIALRTQYRYRHCFALVLLKVHLSSQETHAMWVVHVSCSCSYSGIITRTVYVHASSSSCGYRT